jgi:hypothetical protein
MAEFFGRNFKMNQVEIVDDICEALVGNIEEPAGRGCGYGVTEDGIAEIMAVIKRILPQKEKDMIMSTEPTYAAVKKTRNFKITAIELIQKAHKGTNMLIESDENVILDEALFKGTTPQLAEFAAMKQIEKEGKCDMTMLEITTRPFPG